ncbi:MAG: FG-GAP repeat domain-containing protein [Bryobacteraceae bacterium]
MLLEVTAYCQTVSFLAPTRAFGRGTVGPMDIAGLAAADFNGDGKLDLVDIPGNRSGLSFPLISLGNGDGTFRASVGSSLSIEGLRFAVAADFDIDGRMDVAAHSNRGVAFFWETVTGHCGIPYSRLMEER